MPESGRPPAEAGVAGRLSEIVASGFAGGTTRVGGFAGADGGGTGTSEIVAPSGFGSGGRGGATRDAGFAGGGGVIGTSEIVAPSFGSNGVLPAELSPFAGTPTPKLSRPPFFDLGSSIKRCLPQTVMRRRRPIPRLI